MTDPRRLLTAATLFLLLFIASAAMAQDEGYRPPAKLPLGDTLLSLPSSHMPSAGTWEVKFSHRFNASLDEGSFSDQLHSLFGLDSNADVVFGLSWVARRDLQLSIARSNVNDTLEAAAKYVVLQQARAVPLSATLRGGVDVRTEKQLDDRTSLFVQAIVSRQFGRRGEIFVMPTFVTKAGRAVNGERSGALFQHAFNVPVAAAVMLRPALSVVAEVTPPNRDLPAGFERNLGWAIGIKRALGGHLFEVLLTDHQSALTDQAVTGTYQGTAVDPGSLHLGFNIERRFGH